MRVSVLYNDDAGSGTSASAICQAIERHGHKVACLIEKDGSLGGVFESPSDLIVAAGGDGTVGLLARMMRGHHRPMALLPLGTANNIARSFGWSGPIDEIIDGWRLDQSCAVDLGMAEGNWSARPFIESVGGGLVADVIAAAESDGVNHLTPAASLAHAVDRYVEAVARIEPRPWAIRADGMPLDGDYLFVEVLNIESVGPNFIPTPGVDPCDGRLSIVLATEDDRSSLLDYWRARQRGERRPLELTHLPARDVTLTCYSPLHIDDDLDAGRKGGVVRLRLDAGAFHMLRSS